MRVLVRDEDALVAYLCDLATCGWGGPGVGYEAAFNCVEGQKIISVQFDEDSPEEGNKMVAELAKTGFLDLTENENVYIEDFSNTEGSVYISNPRHLGAEEE